MHYKPACISANLEIVKKLSIFRNVSPHESVIQFCLVPVERIVKCGNCNDNIAIRSLFANKIIASTVHLCPSRSETRISLAFSFATETRSSVRPQPLT